MLSYADKLTLSLTTMQPQWLVDSAMSSAKFAHEMRDGCLGLADPGPMSVFEHVFVEPTSQLERQRSQYTDQNFFHGFSFRRCECEPIYFCSGPHAGSRTSLAVAVSLCLTRPSLETAANIPRPPTSDA